MADHTVTDRFLDEFRRIKQKVDTLRGPHVTNHNDSIVIDAPSVGASSGGDDNDIHPCKITATETGGGLYAGRLLIGGLTPLSVVTANLTMPAGLTDPGGASNLVVLCPFDSGSTSHSLSASTYGFVMLLGFTTETTPRQIGIWIGGWQPPTPRPLYQPLQPINAQGDLAFSRIKFAP